MPSERPSLRGLGFIVLVVLIAGGLLTVTAGASKPDRNSVSLERVMTSWQGETYALGQSKTGDACRVPAGTTLCDSFELGVDIPAEHWKTNAGGVEVKIAWPDEADDFDLFVYDENDELVGSGETGGTSSERVFIDDASGKYRVEVTPYDVSDSSYTGNAHVETRADVGGGPVPTEPLSGAACVDGRAGPFPCKGIDLEGFLPNAKIGGGDLNDIWGWTDPQTGREYALVGKTSGTAFVDISDARNPVYLGDLPSHQPVETIFNTWRDIKVYKDHAFVVSEEPAHGMQVFDLTRLRGTTEAKEWDEDAHYSFPVDGTAGFLEASDRILNPPDNAHNIAINEESGYAYAIGTSTCNGGGPHMIDIRDPQKPKFAGCVSEDGYTHDTQCVNYEEGDPDPAFAGHEICFNSNEDTLTVVDVTDKENPEQLARVPYDGATYSHQGWLTEDRKQFLLDDELDEQDKGGQTRTYVFDVEKLRNPTQVGTYDGVAESIDHNQYVKGARSYQANYRSGLRVLDVSGAPAGRLSETGFFDVYPDDDKPEFNGAWSNYPYFGSGNVVISGIEQGLFVVRPQASVTGEAVPSGDAPKPAAPSAGPGQGAPADGAAPQPRSPQAAAADGRPPFARLGSVPARMRFAAFRRGVTPRVRTSEPAALRFELLRARGSSKAFDVKLGEKSLRAGKGPRSTRIKPSGRRLGRPRSFAARLRVTATDRAGNRRVVTKTIRVTP